MSLETFTTSYVQRLAQGDRETERHFLGLFDDLLTFKLRARLRSKHAVEDLRQETYARVFLALKRDNGLRRPERLGAFVHSVCNHVLLEFYRMDSRTQPLPDRGFDSLEQAIDIESSLVNEERKRRAMVFEPTRSMVDERSAAIHCQGRFTRSRTQCVAPVGAIRAICAHR